MKAGRRLALGLGLVVVAASLGPRDALGSPPAETTATYDGSVIRIKTFIEITGPQATPALAVVIEGEINRVWQDPANAQTYCGIPVEFEAEVRVRQGDGTGGWHQIKIRKLRPGQYFRDYVDSLDVYGWDIGGEWSPFHELDGPYYRTVYAHEAGHLFGAPDEYIEGGWFRGSRSVPGRESSVMNDNVPWVDAYTVNNILGNAFPPGSQNPLPRCIQGETYHEETIVDGGHERTGFLSLTVNLRSAGYEALRGTAIGDFTLAGSYEEAGCSFGYSTAAPIELDLIADGALRGPYTIESELPIIIEEIQRHSLCGDPVDLVIDWEVSLLLEDVVFDVLDLGNGSRIDRAYRLDEETPNGKRQVQLWLNGVEGR